MKKNFRKELLIGLCLLIATTLFFLIFIEVALRIVGIDYAPMVNNDCLGWTFLPDSNPIFKKPEFTTRTSINSEGFRDVNHEVENKEDAYRILVLGDSFVEASQVDFNNTYSQILQKELERISGKNIEVISMGIGGYSTDQELLAMKCYGLKYKPDLVVLSFLTLNDVSGNNKETSIQSCKPFFNLEPNGSLTLDDSFIERCNSFTGKVKKFVAHNSRFAYFMAVNLQKISAKGSVVSDQLPPDFQIYRIKPTSEYVRGWEITEKIILDMQSKANKNGADFLVVVLTNPQQLSWEKTVLKYPILGNGNFSAEAPEKPISEICNKNGLDCLQLLPYFVDYKNSTGNEPHLEVDGHWNELGNWLAGKTVAQHINARKYLK